MDSDISKRSEQPSLVTIQDDADNTGEVPLVLIHDGGGTIFSYHGLEALRRPVFAIPDITFGTAQSWESIAKMAAAYCQLIKEKFIAGPILLGGWSLGGFVSLHMSWLFTQSQDIDVVGLVLIDASHLRASGDLTSFRTDDLGNIFPDVPPLTRSKMEVSIKKTSKLVATWDPPQWTTSLSSMDGVDDDTPKRMAESSDELPPPAALLYAKDHVPPQHGSAGGASLVDACRHKPMLGWTKYDPDLLKFASRIDGHHFSIFDKQNVRRLSKVLADACDALSSGDY